MFYLVLGIIAALIALVCLGISVRPASFSPYSKVLLAQLQTVPLPAGLPAPVERFYRLTYGDQIPLIKTVVVSGRGWMRFFNLPMPIRFRFTHEAGFTYRHDMELTFFGLTWMRGLDTYIDDRGWANTPGIHEGEGFDQGSNVSLWAEALNWFPAILITDPRVTWQPVDDQTTLLKVPYKTATETLVVRFDPETGKVSNIEAMKFKAAIGKKVLWNNGIWFDEGVPWIELNVEDTIYNVDVAEYIRSARK